jgi:hypothetical protein
MAHEDVFLKAAGILPGNGHIAQRPETGGDTVNGPALGNPALDQPAGFTDADLRIGAQFDPAPIAGYSHQVGQGQALHSYLYRLHLATVSIVTFIDSLYFSNIIRIR